MHRIFLLITVLLYSCSNTNHEGTEQSTAQVQQESPAESKKPAATAVSQIDTTRFDLDYIRGKFDPAQHPDFVKIPLKYADREGRYLHRETYEAFLKMWEAARQDGVNLKIISATRNFNAQKGIWEAKWTGRRKVGGKDLSQTIPDVAKRAYKILEYSSMPGTSRHHWGTDIDLNALVNSHFEKGEGLKTYQWLTANAAAYGFCQPYSPKGSERPHGYNEEKWHWSYLPIALPLTKQAELQLKNDMISGFAGAEAASQIDVVQKYVLGINPECL